MQDLDITLLTIKVFLLQIIHRFRKLSHLECMLLLVERLGVVRHVLAHVRGKLDALLIQ